MNSSCQGLASNTLFDELSCIKLEEVTRDKEKYRHKYKSIKKDLLNVSIYILAHFIDYHKLNYQIIYNKYVCLKIQVQCLNQSLNLILFIKNVYN